MPNCHATKSGNIPFTPEEEDEWKAREIAWAAGARDRKAAELRAERNRKITACDWRMLTDSVDSSKWKVYRQALRDIPQQPGFPDNVIWPVEP